MFKNYISKIKFSFQYSSNVSTFFKLLVNSKKYTSTIKNNVPQNNSNKTVASYNFNFSNKVHTIKMRTFSGDIDIFYEIFWKHVYEIPFKFPNEIKTIVDLGAHIGFASIFFRTKFPDSKIYAVEASKENYILLKDNLKNFKNTHHLHAAIFTEDGSVKFNDSGFSYNSKLSSDGESIDAISMNTLMKKNNIEKINLLKIDIEGAEKLILKENNTWLENVENIIIEIHDDYTIKNLEEDLQKFGFTIYEPSNQLGSLKNIFATKLHLNI